MGGWLKTDHTGIGRLSSYNRGRELGLRILTRPGIMGRVCDSQPTTEGALLAGGLSDGQLEAIPVGHTVMRQKLADFDRLAQEMRLRITDQTPVKHQLDTIREFLADETTLGLDELDAKWGPRFLEYFQAEFVVGRFIGAVLELRGLPGLKKILKDKVLPESMVQDFVPTQAKDALYELELAADLKRSGFRVELREPDIVAHENGLSKPLALACKFPSSRQQLHEHLNKGYKQITGQGLDGVVAIGLDLIIGKEAELGLFLDFRRGDKPPMEVLLRQLAEEVKTLEEERPRDYPSERALDGLMLTLMPGGIYGKPARLVTLNGVTLRCAPGNPLVADLAIVKQKLEALNSDGLA